MSLNNTSDVFTLLNESLVDVFNSSNTSSSDTTAESWAHIKEGVEMMEIIVQTIVLIIGLFGNSLIIITMSAKQFRKMPSQIILICLAISDTTMLLTQPFNQQFIRDLLGYDPRAFSDASCKIFYMFYRTSKMTSSWFIVILCFERFIAVVFPFHVKQIITKKLMNILIAVNYGVMITFNFFWRFSTTVDKGRCKKDSHTDGQPYKAFTLSGSLLYSIIPIVIMSTLVPIIIRKLVKSRNLQQSKTTTSSGTKPSRMNNNVLKISMILVIIVLAYIVCILPMTIFQQIRFWKNVKHGSQSLQMFLVIEIVQRLEQINYAVNFFLYIMACTTFRQTVFEWFCCKSRKQDILVVRSTKCTNTNTSTTVSIRQDRGDAA